MAPGEKPSMQPSNIADVILFLASDAAAMINGAAIPVDQGVCNDLSIILKCKGLTFGLLVECCLVLKYISFLGRS